MRKILSVLAVVLLVPVAAGAVSESVTPWLLFSMGARASGMGGAHITEASGADGVYWNPANLGYIRGPSLTGMHFAPVPDLTDDVYFEYASYAKWMEGIGGVGGNIMFLTYGTSEATDASGIRLREFTSWEMGIGGGWGTEISSHFAAGAGAKILLSYLSPEIGELEEGQGITWAIDMGVHGHDLGPWGLRWALAIQNMGPALKFVDNGSPNPLPLNFRMGLGVTPFENDVHRISVVADVNKVLVRQRGGTGTEEFSVDPAWKALFTAWTDESLSDEFKDIIYNYGMEYSFADFVFLRAGWVHDQTGDITDYTYGIGVSYASARIDFAGYPQATGLDDVKRFSLSYEF
ncbi:MAG: PorV/PorQ family protein [Gemmatimonadota bacterium]|jgi:hypothetical protein|nr:PorV/PorQ family protein [Gemmatimonadota bacterium]MDP6802783.1 PorV/PorQ family protein [Gemmatimonadota bacterium]MDP7032093.1 PorV/PorQ family protein [Gemmatimonadota bacterium]